MHQLVSSNLPEIEAICRRRRVRTLELFGSGTRDDPDEPADFDFLVDFLEPREHAADTYFGMVDDLEKLLGRKVDLVVKSAVKNPYFWMSIEPARTRLYAV